MELFCFLLFRIFSAGISASWEHDVEYIRARHEKEYYSKAEIPLIFPNLEKYSELLLHRFCCDNFRNLILGLLVLSPPMCLLANDKIFLATVAPHPTPMVIIHILLTKGVQNKNNHNWRKTFGIHVHLALLFWLNSSTKHKTWSDCPFIN